MQSLRRNGRKFEAAFILVKHLPLLFTLWVLFAIAQSDTCTGQPFRPLRVGNLSFSSIHIAKETNAINLSLIQAQKSLTKSEFVCVFVVFVVVVVAVVVVAVVVGVVAATTTTTTAAAAAAAVVVVVVVATGVVVVVVVVVGSVVMFWEVSKITA